MDKFYLDLGLKPQSTRSIIINPPSNILIEQSVIKGQGRLAQSGALIVKTGKHTGRSAKDKYIVKNIESENSIWWENDIHPMSTDQFMDLKSDVLAYLNEDKDLYITETSVGAHEKHNIGIRLITSHPSHALFSQYLFRKKIREFGDDDFTIIHAPEFQAPIEKYGNHSETIVATCFKCKTTIIVGTLYAGEIKKSMFCVMSYVLPERNILPMHSGCNRLQNGDVSVFFGLSGTGKTTLSTDEGTLLIGDDEHGLSDEGVFNFEGGCYAKTYRLSEETEPGIFRASNRFGGLLENVVLNPKTGKVDFFDKSLSENGRASYPLSFIDDLEKSSQGKVPHHIFFLCADAFGVLPPVAKLTKEQAMDYFILGYTAKVAGTEIGVKEPQETFSPCFGAPFMLRHPKEYAKLLGEYLDKYPIKIWLINTGWTGGPYGEGQRFPLHTTRKIIRTIQSDQLKDAKFEKDPYFDLEIPCHVDKIPVSLLFPEKSWENPEKYAEKAKQLSNAFKKQMELFS